MLSLHENDSHDQDPQLNLPTGPLGVVRERRERTDEDRRWHGEQLSVHHENRVDRAVYERMAFYGSLNPDRIAFPAVATLARGAQYSERSTRYALRRLESSGLVQCVFHGRGRSTSQYRIVGSSDCRPDLQTVPLRPANAAPKVLKEGLDRKNKDLSFKAEAKSIDPQPVQTEGLTKAVVLTDFPSKEKKQEKPPVPKEPKKAPPPCEPVVFTHTKQVSLLFKLQRKLGYRADDGQARVFDDLEHTDKKRILDTLLAEEQLAAAKGQCEAPPKKPRAPRFAPVQTPIREEASHCVSDHRWTEPASDGVQNCIMCPAERKSKSGAA